MEKYSLVSPSRIIPSETVLFVVLLSAIPTRLFVATATQWNVSHLARCTPSHSVNRQVDTIAVRHSRSLIPVIGNTQVPSPWVHIFLEYVSTIKEKRYFIQGKDVLVMYHW